MSPEEALLHSVTWYIITGQPKLFGGDDPDSFARRWGVAGLACIGLGPPAPHVPRQHCAHMPPPLPTLADLARNPDAAWEAIALHVERAKVMWVPERVYPSAPNHASPPSRPLAGQWIRTAAWWEEACADAERTGAERARVDAEARARAEFAARRKEPRAGRVVSDRERASAYLATLETGPGGAWMACLYMVRGFALGVAEGAALVLSEYAPRYHRKMREREVVDMARRAERCGRMEWGEKLRR